jgi:hypothetical protein
MGFMFPPFLREFVDKGRRFRILETIWVKLKFRKESAPVSPILTRTIEESFLSASRAGMAALGYFLPEVRQLLSCFNVGWILKLRMA